MDEKYWKLQEKYWKLKGAMDKTIDIRIEKARETIKRLDDKIRNNENNTRLDKLYLKNRKKEEENIRAILTRLQSELSSLNFATSNKYVIPEDLNDRLKELAGLLGSKEALEFKRLVNKCIRKCDRAKRDKINSHKDKINKTLKSLGRYPYNVKLPVFFHENDKLMHLSFEDAVRQMCEMKYSELFSDSFFAPSKKEDNDIYFMDSLGSSIKRVSDLAKEGKLKIDKNSKSIITNMAEIKATYLKMRKLRETIRVMDNITSKLDEEEATKINVDFSELKKFFSKFKKKAKKEIKKCEKYLSKYNFNSVTIKIDEIEEKERKTSEKVSDKTSDKVSDKASDKVSDKTSDKVSDKTSDKVSEKVRDEEIQEAYRTHNENISPQTYRDARERLKQIAIRELGGASSINAINDMIAKMTRIAKMTAIERGIDEYRSEGHPDATIESLSESQKRDFKVAYRDSSYSYVAEVKECLEIIDKAAASVFSSYIKYLAREEDKENAQSFEQYAAMLGYIGIEQSTVSFSQSGGIYRR